MLSPKKLIFFSIGCLDEVLRSPAVEPRARLLHQHAAMRGGWRYGDAPHVLQPAIECASTDLLVRAHHRMH